MKKLLSLLILLPLSLGITATTVEAQETQLLERVYPEQVGLDSHAFALADSVILDAIEEGQIPGGVLAVVRHNKLAYLKAYGHKSLVPEMTPMTTETIFDLASVTKPLSTGIATMILLQEGKILLQDRVSRYLPYWDEDDRITIRHLLTHTSGLPSYAPVEKVKNSPFGTTLPEKLAYHIATVERIEQPGERMIYSCLNFITLQRIIEVVTGQSLQDFTQERIYQPMGLTHTGFKPSAELLPMVAPTEVQADGKPLLGVVHDPLARELNLGVSGNAGLFSNAEEIAAICSMLLSEGYSRGHQILSPAAVKAFTTVPRGYEKFARTLGWSSYDAYASNNGNLSTSTVYGHTGYTGTSVSVDPERDLAIIFLSNRVHPADTTSTSRVNATLHNIISAAVRDDDYFSRFPQLYFDRLELYKEEEPIHQQDIVMLGNSITEGGRDWNKLLPKVQKRIVNRGISGDTTRGILHRLDEIERQKPHRLFLLIGINDVSHHLNDAQITDGITYIIERIHSASPETEIILQTLFPINEEMERFSRYKGLAGKTYLVPKINTRLKALPSTHPYIKLIDLYPHFVKEDGLTLREDLTYDGLHLNARGYEIWTEILAPYMK
ncbi:MAG: serine hydrolase [Porphyromonas sp.]|nr:serine hydrolase [Porphyromonas sp.]